MLIHNYFGKYMSAFYHSASLEFFFFISVTDSLNQMCHIYMYAIRTTILEFGKIP